MGLVDVDLRGRIGIDLGISEEFDQVSEFHGELSDGEIIHVGQARMSDLRETRQVGKPELPWPQLLALRYDRSA